MMLHERITTITLDGDQTLWDFYAAMRKALAAALAEIQSRVDTAAARELTVEKMVTIREEVWLESKNAAARLDDIRLVAFERTLDRVGAPDPEFAAELNTFYRERRFACIELYPDVGPALDHLCRHFKLGLLSNGNTYPPHLQLDRYFDFVIFAQDVGCAKPGPEIFQIAWQRAGCSPDQLLHVGDSVADDVEGARACGITSVWLNRDGASDGGVDADYTICSFTDLVALLS